MRAGWTWGWQFDGACRGEDSSLFFAPSYFEKREEKAAREVKARRHLHRLPGPRNPASGTPFGSASRTGSGAASTSTNGVSASASRPSRPARHLDHPFLPPSLGRPRRRSIA